MAYFNIIKNKIYFNDEYDWDHLDFTLKYNGGALYKPVNKKFVEIHRELINKHFINKKQNINNNYLDNNQQIIKNKENRNKQCFKCSNEYKENQKYIEYRKNIYNQYCDDMYTNFVNKCFVKNTEKYIYEKIYNYIYGKIYKLTFHKREINLLCLVLFCMCGFYFY